MSPATWVPAVNARRVRQATCFSAPAGNPRANRSAVDEASAAATSACAMNQSSERSTAASASATTSPVLDTKASSAQVGRPPTYSFEDRACRVMLG